MLAALIFFATFTVPAPVIAQTNPAQGVADETQSTEFLQTIENASGFASHRIVTTLTHIPNIPKELGHAFNRLSEGSGIPRFLGMLIVILGLLAAGYGVEILFKRYTSGFYRQVESIPRLGEIQKFWGATLRIVTDLLGLFIFAVFSLVFFMLIYGTGRSSARLIFVALLVALLGSRAVSALSNTLFSPKAARLRLIELSDATAGYLHRALVLLALIIAFGWVFCRVIFRLGVLPETFLLMIIMVGTIVIAILAVMVWKNRRAVSLAISGNTATQGDESWLAAQFAAIWHVLALGYLFIVWLLWSGQLIIFQSGGRGTFFVSLLIVPIFLAADRLGQWVVTSIMGTARIKRYNPQQPGAEAAETPIDTGDTRYLLVARKIVRVFISLALAFWLLSIWGLHLPFGEKLTRATFNILVTLALAHIFWRVANGFINRKLHESMPKEAQDDDQDKADEWGAAATLARSHTLLPMLRKFIGSVLVTMVVMIALSSMGVDIAPLLAGAGVVGLAVGFGARKLVSDIFSGFFFLMDDAFRVGEYLKSGSTSGVVEKISLRNIFLRHHRGMLQIVPYSDLGAITNFMRGGLVEKFNLQLPYDTNIDKVRKIIKKVGEKMLEDEELGPNFIQPLKSQGVREVGDSVMTFRVKFTAKPGKQFLIRREAFRLITRALEKEGIHYAHRKVIVDYPAAPTTAAPENAPQTDESGGNSTLLQTQPGPGIATAGAAAALGTILDEEKKEKADKGKK
jgi:small-conductance mechanosensitive channel